MVLDLVQLAIVPEIQQVSKSKLGVVLIFWSTRPRPAVGLGGSSGGRSFHGSTYDATLRACCAQLGGDVNLFSYF